MKTITRTKICLPMAAMILTAALAIPAAAQVAFKGAMQGNNVDSPTPPPPGTIVVTTSGTGVGTQFGAFSFTQETTVDLASGTETGTAHWTAANGDSIDTTFVGSTEKTDTAGVHSITDVYTVTAGTGRFAGAQGTFIVDRLISGAAFLTSGSFHGIITFPAAAQ